MRIILSLLLCLLSSICFSQTEHCSDSSRPIAGTFSFYSVNVFSTKTPVEIIIDRISYKGKEIKVSFDYKDSIEYETPLLPITDSIAVKMLLSKIVRYGEKRYMYNIFLFVKDIGNCWIGGSEGDFMSIVTDPNMKIDQPFDPKFYPDQPRINKGMIKINGAAPRNSGEDFAEVVFKNMYNDTVDASKLRMVIIGNDYKNRKYYKKGDTIPFSGYRVTYFPKTHQLESIIFFKNGKYYNGELTTYYRNGQKKEVSTTNWTSEQDGHYIKWFENGTKQIEGDYRDDKKVGKWTIWNEKGKIIKEENFENGIVK